MDNFTEWFPWLFGGGTFLFVIIVTVCSLAPFVLIFGGLGYWFYKRSKQAQAVRASSQSWVQTTGTVITSRVEVSGGETTSVSPRVIYQYSVGAQTYQSDQIRAGDHLFKMTSSGDAYNTVDRYPVGAQVVVFYDPTNPAHACLER